MPAVTLDYENPHAPVPSPELADLSPLNTAPLPIASPGRSAAGSAPGAGSARHANPGDVIRLRGMREQLKSIDNAYGGGTALPMTMGYLRQEAPLLNGLKPADPTARALIDVFALTWLDAGWMAYDAAEQQLATQNFTRALRLARVAGDRLLGGRVLAAMSHQAIYLGRVRQAIDYAQAARAAARIVATPRSSAMFAAMQACAHAAAGDETSCHQALDQAAQAIGLRRGAQPEPEGLDFDEGGYWGHAARAYRDLGRLADAEQAAQKSVGLCLPAHGRTRAQRYAIHAVADLRMGEIDAAAAAAGHIVGEAWTLHSSHVFGDIAQLAWQLAGYRTPVAADFLGQARELLEARGPMGPRSMPEARQQATRPSSR